jgi:hypothetical protein
MSMEEKADQAQALYLPEIAAAEERGRRAAATQQQR